MARVVPEDPFGGLAAEAAPPTPVRWISPMRPSRTPRPCCARAAAAEEAALAVPGITNSEGAEAGYGRAEMVLVTSAGFAGRFARTSHSVSATALAGQGTGMQRDYDYSSAVHLADLDDAAAIGRIGGERADRPAQSRAARRRPNCRWSTIRASRAGCSAISRARSTVPPWRAGRPSSRTSSGSRMFPEGNPGAGRSPPRARPALAAVRWRGGAEPARAPRSRTGC